MALSFGDFERQGRTQKSQMLRTTSQGGDFYSLLSSVWTKSHRPTCQTLSATRHAWKTKTANNHSPTETTLMCCHSKIIVRVHTHSHTREKVQCAHLIRLSGKMSPAHLHFREDIRQLFAKNLHGHIRAAAFPILQNLKRSAIFFSSSFWLVSFVSISVEKNTRKEYESTTETKFIYLRE